MLPVIGGFVADIRACDNTKQSGIAHPFLRFAFAV